MMIGADMAKRMVSDYLQEDLPRRLTRYRNTWNLSNRDLPDVSVFKTWEPLELDAWPSIISVILATSQIDQDDYEGDDPQYTVVYQVRTYIWCRAHGSRAATEQRDRLTTVVREALLDHPALASRNENSPIPCQIMVMQDTMTEEFSDLTLLKGDRVMAGAYVGYDLMLEETITRPEYDDGSPLATLIDPRVDVVQMSKLPNAPTYLQATAMDSRVDLVWRQATWDGGVYPITGYRIEQTTDGGATWTVAIADTEWPLGEYDVQGLTNGTTYQFRVAAINAAGVGGTSPESLEVTPTA